MANRISFIMGVLMAALVAVGAEVKDREWINLYEGPAPGATGEGEKHTPAIQPYLVPKEKATGATVIVFPGGGYGGLAMDHEGKQIGEFLNSNGITAFVLRYRLGSSGYRHPVEMNDAKRAIRYVRSHAKEWGLDPGRIGIIGFSAGGHLASTASTHFDDGDASAQDPVERVSSRPDSTTLVYPVITMGKYTHQGSKQNLLGKDPDASLVELMSNEKQVTDKTPPTFLMHSISDKAVVVQNSDMYAGALAAHGVPYAYVRGELGQHGVGLTDGWKPQWLAWLRETGYAAKEEPRADRSVFVFPWNADVEAVRGDLRRALTDGVDSLGGNQKFNLLMFGREGAVHGWDSYRLRDASDENKAQVKRWLGEQNPRAGDPEPALREAFAQDDKLGAVYLYADRDYQGERLVKVVRELNAGRARKVKVYTVAVVSKQVGAEAAFVANLKRISEESGGTHQRLTAGGDVR
jgi:acetyl esterase/lipase